MPIQKLLTAAILLALVLRVPAQTWVVPDEQKAVTAPFRFTPEMQKQGEPIYLKNCQSCHGQPGKDNWVKLTPPPGDLAASRAQRLTDGEFFYKITTGKAPMPEFRNILSEEERWWLVAYLRSFNAGYVQPEPSAKALFTGRTVKLGLGWDEKAKKVEVTATELLKDGQNAPAAGVGVMLFAKRFFGRMQVDETRTTNVAGKAWFEVPADLPGNAEGYVELFAAVNDPRSVMRTTPADSVMPVGKPMLKPGLTDTRAWWTTRDKAPVWIAAVYTLSVLIVWGFIFYILYLVVVKMRRLGKQAGTFLLLLALIFGAGWGAAPLQAMAPEEEVGITEHLDTIIPQGFMFNNEQGQPVELRSLITKPTILVLVYYDCPGICPMILGSVSDVIEKMGMELGKDYQVITVSFNPGDTPESSLQLKKNYLRDHSRSRAEHWSFLTGDSANIGGLVRTVGYRFVKTGNDFMHPSCIMVVSPQAKVTRYLYGTTYLPFDVKMALIEAQKGQSRPTINRVLEYCFSYDPEGRKYTLQVTKISATIIIFVAVVLFLGLMIRSTRKKNKTQNP